MNLLGVLNFFSSALVLGLGVLVYWRRGSSGSGRIFAWFCLTVFGWLFGYGLMQLPSSPHEQLLWAKFGHSFVIFVPISYVHFVMYFLNLQKIRLWVSFYYIFGFVSLVLLHASDWYVPSIKQHEWGPYPVGGPVMWVDFIVLILFAGYCWTMFLLQCRQAHRTSSVEEYNRLKYGSIAMTILSLSAYDFIPKLSNIECYPFGFGTTAIFVVVVSYAILKQRLMDLNIAIRSTVVYSILAALITAIYFMLVTAIERLLQGFVGYQSFLTSLAASFVIALGFNPLKETLQYAIDRVFFGSRGALAVENERLRQEVTRSERLKAVATLAAGMAHEIKNPLASIKTFAEYLPQRYDQAEFREKFSRIVGQEVEKITDLVRQLLDFARPTPPALRPERLSSLVNEILDLLHGTFLERQISVSLAMSGTEEVLADRAQIKQALLNVLLNSVEAMEHPGTITISSAQQNGYVHLSITDSGPGMTGKALQHAFDPFYTTKPHGSGLGLSVVHSIAREHRGRVRIESAIGRGTTVTMTLPTNGRSHEPLAHSSG